MEELIANWVCLNCFFIGKHEDRELLCCDKPRIFLATEYYSLRKEEVVFRSKIRNGYLSGNLSFESLKLIQ